MLSVDKINKLKEENAVLQAYKDVNEDFKTAWEELKAENELLREEINQLHNSRNPEELYTLFGKPIRYWEELKAENDSLKEENYQLQKDCQICENFIDFIPCKPIRDMDYDLQKVINQRDNYYQTLQEIKTIAKKIIIAYTGIAKSNEKLKAFDLRNRLQQILQKITKAEEE